MGEEVDLKRLLHRTELLVSTTETNVLVGDSLQRQSIQGNLERLRELMESYGGEEEAARVGQLEATFDIASLVDTDVLPAALSRAPRSVVAQRARGRALVQEAKKKDLLSVHEEELMTRDEFERQREKLQSEQGPEDTDALAQVSWEEMLAWHRKEQEDMAAEMESNSVLMRQAAEQINEALKEDKRVLDEVQQKTDVNMDKMAHESDRIRTQTKNTCSFTWISLFLCLLMFVIFVGMVMFMKVASKGVS